VLIDKSHTDGALLSWHDADNIYFFLLLCQLLSLNVFHVSDSSVKVWHGIVLGYVCCCFSHRDSVSMYYSVTAIVPTEQCSAATVLCKNCNQ